MYQIDARPLYTLMGTNIGPGGGTGALDLSGLTRRDALKRGAIIGGVALWLTPAIEILGVGRRHAQAASGPPPATAGDKKVKDDKVKDDKKVKDDEKVKDDK